MYLNFEQFHDVVNFICRSKTSCTQFGCGCTVVPQCEEWIHHLLCDERCYEGFMSRVSGA